MNLLDLDRRIRAVEAKFLALEGVLRTKAFRILLILLAGAALIGVVAGIAVYGREYYVNSKARSDRIDMALASEFPSLESPYCRWVYQEEPGYQPCLEQEQHGFSLFEAAWARSRGVNAIRDQLIGCYSAARNAYGTSWKTAAHCAELEDDLPENKGLQPR